MAHPLMTKLSHSPNRFFSPDPGVRHLAGELYQSIEGTPLICPHGHVDAHLFSELDASFGSPADLLIIPDHYIIRMLYSQGIPLEKLGIPRVDGGPVETDHRQIWRLFCENFYLFRGTPSGVWFSHELSSVFGIDEKPCTANADSLYEAISNKLGSPDFSPRRLYERFNIKVLCTTDTATDPLDAHQSILTSGWQGRILPTFRPDALINLCAPGWKQGIDMLSNVSGIAVTDYRSFIKALEQRREFFKSMGAVATDHAIIVPATFEISPDEAEQIIQRALKGQTSGADADRFTAHMLMEMARMSVEDGLVMQLHPGSLRNHNRDLYLRFGADKGADIPVQTEYTRNLLPVLNKYGNDSRLSLIIFTLDESAYSRELATLAGHYPALKLGPPWWFHDSLNGMTRYFDQVMESAGIYNTSGFNDDTSAFCSIPARHDVWRRVSANWIAGLVTRHIIDMDDANDMMFELTIGLASRTYHL
jgi:glucuronate isomerase